MEKEMVIWQNKDTREEQRIKDRDQVQFRVKRRGFFRSFLCVCVCVRTCVVG